MILFQRVRYQIWSVLVATILAVCSVANGEPNMESKVISWQAPTGEVASLDYELTENPCRLPNSMVWMQSIRWKILPCAGSS